MKAIIIQPGKLGDIILLSPIAKFYHEKGYDVFFPTFSNFKTFFNNIDYINHIDFDISLDTIEYHNSSRMKMWDMNKSFEQQQNSIYQLDGFKKSISFFDKLYKHIEEEKYDLILDPCWGFAGHIDNTRTQQIINQSISQKKKWITTKYSICNVPIENRNDFVWNRNEDKEEELFQFIKSYSLKKYGDENYSIVHSYKSDRLPAYSVVNPINLSYIEGYEVYDWLKVLENAKTIACSDSSVCHFVESQKSLFDIPKIYLGSEEEHWSPFMFNILKNNWTNYTNSDITNE